MGHCSVCGESDDMPYSCNYCGRKHCSKHQLPENHNCPKVRGSNITGKRFESAFDDSVAASSVGSSAHEPMDEGEIRTYGTEEAVENLDSSPPVRKKSESDDGLKRIQEEQKSSFLDRAITVILTPFFLLAFVLRRLFSARVLLVCVLGVATVGQLGIVGVPGFPVNTSPVESVVDDAGSAVANASSDTTHADQTERSGSGGSATEADLNRTRIEYLVHKEINDRRHAHDLRPIQFDNELRKIARYHSRDMAKNQYFSHESPGGETMADRYDKFGYDCRVDMSRNQYATGAENIAYTYAYENVVRENGDTVYYSNEKEIANGLVNGWMNSTGHRKNILKPYWENEGIGIHIAEIDGKMRVYATQNFC